jgi:uncharacterized pyridoxal phosphate-containing UPF0001 family protein
MENIDRKEPLEIFLQINVSSEENKQGFPCDSSILLDIIDKFQNQLKIKILGLMCIGQVDQSERDFLKMVELKNCDDLKKFDLKLSFGMSNDYELAVKFD